MRFLALKAQGFPGIHGIQVGDGSGQYLKVGYNGWDDDSEDSRIYYDNLRVYEKQ